MSHTPAPAPSTPVRIPPASKISHASTGLITPPPTPSSTSIPHTACNTSAPPTTIPPSKQDDTEVPVPPLKVSSNRWDRKTLAALSPNSPSMVHRKVTALLNKLTIEKFDSISYQLIARANASENKKDARSITQIVGLIYDKAIDEPVYSAVYARLCRKMMEQIYDEVQVESVKDNEGKPLVGGQLFCKYLLIRCQWGFELGWVTSEGMTSLYSDEYYAARKARRQGLGLIRFIGELFKLQRVTEGFIHKCIKKFLGDVDIPREEDIESLCILLTTIGQILDTPKARAHLDVYFSRMKALTKNRNLRPPLRNMLLDVINLRGRRCQWVNRTSVAGPIIINIAQIHGLAAKEVEAAEKARHQRQIRRSLRAARRGDGSGDGSYHPLLGRIQKGDPVGHGVPRPAASTSPSPPSPKAGGSTLPNFGEISSSESKIRAPMTPPPPCPKTCTNIVDRPKITSDGSLMCINQANQTGALVVRQEASERILQRSTMTGNQGVVSAENHLRRWLNIQTLKTRFVGVQNHKREPEDLIKMISESLRRRQAEATPSYQDGASERPASKVGFDTHKELEGSKETADSDIAAIKHYVRSLVERMKGDESPESNSGPRKEAKYIKFSVRDETDKTMIAIVNLSLIVNDSEEEAV